MNLIKQIKEILNSVGISNYYVKNKDLKQKLKKESSDKMLVNNFEWSFKISSNIKILIFFMFFCIDFWSYLWYN